MTAILRSRTISDAHSGLSLNAAEWPGYSSDDLARHFELFNRYDIDSSGFISKENLLDVLQAMEVDGANLDMCTAIIDEVAVLCNHDNDGVLSFRDYMKAIEYDHQAARQNQSLDAVDDEAAEDSGAESAEETGAENANKAKASVGAERAPAEATAADALQAQTAEAEEAAPPPRTRVRHTSLSVVHELASSRIAAFQQVVNDAQAAASKLRAFQQPPAVLDCPLVNSDEMQKETLANKVKAFEVACKFKGTVELKKTWRVAHGGHGNYTPGQRLVIGGAPAKPPPRKKISELP